MFSLPLLTLFYLIFIQEGLMSKVLNSSTGIDTENQNNVQNNIYYNVHSFQMWNLSSILCVSFVPLEIKFYSLVSVKP